MLFCLIYHVLYLIEVFLFGRSHLLIIALSVCAIGVILRKWSPSWVVVAYTFNPSTWEAKEEADGSL